MEIVEQEMKRPGQGGHNDCSDAKRHAETSRRIAKEVNQATAWVAGVVHEIDNLINDDAPWSEVMMDLHNNQEGRNAAAEGRAVDPANLVPNPGSAGTVVY